MSERPCAEIHAELDALSAEFVAAFEAWREVGRRYRAVHREWFELAHPGVEYDATFGGDEIATIDVPVEKPS